MRLKSLELHGFKSFPDKTVINFDKGMTVIVGPNGSGKSNISDAMRWVLGELSTKNIRGTKMEDVIFGGSSTRSPMSYAEVSLTIENTGEGNRIPVDYDEIEVTRRYYRTGESEYMINRRPARLKDITEMFMNTGLGKTGYSIVSQGKAAEIISQKSDERRTVFEEAAGISKYRYKKNEAERRLSSTSDNLLRLNDIKSELESRVGPLEKEAEKAKRYLEYYDKKKQAEVSLWLFDVKELKDKLDTLKNDFALSGKQLEIYDETLRSLDEQNEKIYLESQQNKLMSEKNDTELKEANQRRYALESNIKVLENELLHTNEDLIRLKNDIENSKKELDEKEKRIETEKTALEQLKSTLSFSQQNREKADRELEDAQLDLISLENELDDLRNEVKKYEDKLVEEQMHLSSLSGSRKTEDERKDSLLNETEQISLDLRMLTERAEKAEKTIEGYMHKADEAESMAEKCSESCRELEERKKALSEKQNSVYVELASKKQRSEALRRMEEHFEGYQNSVRYVMQKSNDGTLEGICGPVSKLMNVQSRYSVALETALGANLQNIIVETETAAKRAIALLKQNNAGRATFYPLTSIKPSGLGYDAEKVSHNHGFIGLANEIAQFDAKYKPVFDYLLGRTVIFDNIDSASMTAKEFGYKFRIVTLDGQIINAGGSYTGGSAKRDSGILTRSGEIEKLEKDCETLGKQADELKNQYDELDKQTSALEKERDSYSGNASLLKTLQNAEQTQYEVLKTQINADTERLEAAKAELRGLDTSGNLFNTEKERISSICEEIQKQIDTVNTDISDTSERINSKNQLIESLREKNSRSVIKLAEDRKDVESAEKSLISLQSETETVRQNIILLEERNEKQHQSQSLSQGRLNNDKAKLNELVKETELLEQEKGNISEKSDEFEKKLNEIRQKIKDKTNERELAFRAHTQQESKLQTLQTEYDKSSERIWEEYELTYSAAVELGYPEVTKENRQQSFVLFTEYKNKMRGLGNVNVGAIDEYKEVKERFDFMSEQIKDLETSQKQLTDIINKLEVEMRERFAKAMKDINMHFKTVFRELFGGGTAEVVLSDPENVLESGIDINVAPPGKIIKNLVSLSGGEQSFVAIALFFAILKVNPTPFCILDEIESALDEVNVVKFAEYAKKYADVTQFITITHRRGTMESADTLYGVTMYEKGISRVLTVNVREIEDKLGVKLN